MSTHDYAKTVTLETIYIIIIIINIAVGDSDAGLRVYGTSA